MKKDRSPSLGFTLIELLVVIIVLGILASIAIPTYRSFTSDAYNSAMRSDMKNTIQAEDYFAVKNGGKYSATLAELWVDADVSKQVFKQGDTTNISLTYTPTGTSKGYTLTAHSPTNKTDQECGFWTGDATAVAVKGTNIESGQLICN